MVCPPSLFSPPSLISFAASSSLFMPSLKPFTAAPRSLPILRNFLVPKIIATTNNTISQCQILNPPISFSFKLVMQHNEKLIAPHHGWNDAATDDVNMKMKHFLPATLAGVDHSAETMIQSLFFCQPGRQQ